MAAKRRKRILWTSDDIKLLRQQAGKSPVAAIAKKLRRSEAAVRFKAFTKRIRLARKRA